MLDRHVTVRTNFLDLGQSTWSFPSKVAKLLICTFSRRSMYFLGQFENIFLSQIWRIHDSIKRHGFCEYLSAFWIWGCSKLNISWKSYTGTFGAIIHRIHWNVTLRHGVRKLPRFPWDSQPTFWLKILGFAWESVRLFWSARPVWNNFSPSSMS